MQPVVTLGLFDFRTDTAPLESISSAQKIVRPGTQRVGAGPVYQFVGPGEMTKTLTGCLFPGQLTAGASSLAALRAMAASERAYILIRGGQNLGAWFVGDIDDTESHFVGNGLPRKITFSVTLTRCWDISPQTLGDITISDPRAYPSGTTGTPAAASQRRGYYSGEG